MIIYSIDLFSNWFDIFEWFLFVCFHVIQMWGWKVIFFYGTLNRMRMRKRSGRIMTRKMMIKRIIMMIYFIHGRRLGKKKILWWKVINWIYKVKVIMMIINWAFFYHLIRWLDNLTRQSLCTNLTPLDANEDDDGKVIKNCFHRHLFFYIFLAESIRKWELSKFWISIFSSTWKIITELFFHHNFLNGNKQSDSIGCIYFFSSI